MKTVLIVTTTEDAYCTPRVVAALRGRGARVVCLETDRFPYEVRLAAGLDGGRLRVGDEQVDEREVDAVWHRRTLPARLPLDMDPEHRAASVAESSRVLAGWLARLPTFHLDPPARSGSANNKQAQLEVARRVGLDVPRTLIGNDPDAVRAFAATCPGGMVTKLMSNARFYAGGVESAVFTSEVREEDLEDLDGLALCPMTFQEKVPKACELRVTVIGRRVFAAAVDSQARAETALDWRRDGVGLVDTWTRHELAPDVAAKLLAVNEALGLNYGAHDLVVTPDGRVVFLEVNPYGEWFWLEDHPGFPLSDALADVLLGEAERV